MIHLHRYQTLTGVDTYTDGLVRGLSELGLKPAITHAKKHEITLCGKRAGGTLSQYFSSKNQPTVPGALVHHAALNWVLSDHATSVMLHDLNPLILPGFHGNLLRWQKRRLREVQLIVPTQSVKQAVIYWLNVDPDKITVALHGADHIPKNATRRYPLDYLFFAGDMRSYKRVEDGIKLAAHRGLGFVRVGPPAVTYYAKAVNELGRKLLGNKYQDYGYVDQPTYSRLLRNAQAMIFLSKYEGFGLPPLEAMRVGVPVILADTPVNREIYGNHGIYEKSAWAADYGAQTPAALAGYTDRFTWQQSAKAHLEAWNK